MKKIIKNINIILAVFIAFAASSCLDDYETDYGKGPIIVQFSDKTVSQNFLQDGTGAVYEFSVPIEYQGGDGSALDEDVTITIAVNPSSTATEGVEFNLTGTEFTIPAGEKFAEASISVNSENLDASNPLTAVLEITTSSQTVSDKNTIEITLQAICPSELEGDYTYIQGYAVSLTNTGPGTYSISNDDYFGGAYPIYISDVCGVLTVTGGYLADNFGIPVSGYGSVDPDTGTITLTYTVDGYFANRTMIIEK